VTWELIAWRRSSRGFSYGLGLPGEGGEDNKQVKLRQEVPASIFVLPVVQETARRANDIPRKTLRDFERLRKR
jgi:hypothetical protein